MYGFAYSGRLGIWKGSGDVDSSPRWSAKRTRPAKAEYFVCQVDRIGGRGPLKKPATTSWPTSSNATGPA
jgi:hypothetical protein